jgi:hypothetical protein
MARDPNCDFCLGAYGICTECEGCMFDHCECDPCAHGKARIEECIFCDRHSVSECEQIFDFGGPPNAKKYER